jgi:hypothetical protein
VGLAVAAKSSAVLLFPNRFAHFLLEVRAFTSYLDNVLDRNDCVMGPCVDGPGIDLVVRQSRRSDRAVQPAFR